MAAPIGDSAAPADDDLAHKVPAGTVLPPKVVRSKIEKVASYVSRAGEKFEDSVRQKNAGTNQTTFLEPDDPYFPYYKWRVGEIKAGRGHDPDNNAAAKTEVTFQGRESRAPKPPAEFKFSARMPNISAQDLEIVKVTALYAAKNGRSWVTALSQREGGNYQFDFLRPQHSLNMFYTKLVDQYKDLLEGETADGGKPQRERIADLEANVGDRFRMLERAKKRAEWLKWQEKQKVETEQKEEKDRIAFAEIDWHDFTVVATVVFDERDEQADMPAPKTLNDMLSLSLEEKANMRVGVDKRLEEAVPDFTDYEAIYGHAQPMPAAQMPAPPQQQYTPQPTPPQATPYIPPQAPTLAAERENARAATKSAQPTTRIRNDYIPQAQLRAQRNPANTSICPNCNLAFPNDEMAEHMRIEMLDPQWREQSRKDQMRSSTTNLSTSDVATNLKRLASQRSDVFDPAVSAHGVQNGNERGAKRVEVEKGVGHQAPPGTDVKEQIRSLHEKASVEDDGQSTEERKPKGPDADDADVAILASDCIMSPRHFCCRAFPSVARAGLSPFEAESSWLESLYSSYIFTPPTGQAYCTKIYVVSSSSMGDSFVIGGISTFLPAFEFLHD
ncbi:unnamed protein product [Zymoseptoria tritici ST99CH_3D7]|uniref:SURP motif domain-containing protein n=1 Tax=Zymoseptoria tritici (strain ST99CH_3D7) TaxID=1276538 RepID=A0A1X7S8Y4_ZYMT9|nr:unnamed protein product [Zymoseptoria tritici ST99CH_3D7]